MRCTGVILALSASLLCVSDLRAQTVAADRKPGAALASLPATKAGGPLRILLVDDNASPNNIAGNLHRNAGSDEVYREMVAAAVGGDANAWSLEVAPARKDGPAFERLSAFNVVVWYTGDSYGAGADTLSKQDEGTVRRYLQETGGAFILISPGYVNNLVYGSTWERAEYPFLAEVMGVSGVAPLAQRFASGRVEASNGTGFTVAHPGVAETQFSAVNSNGAAILFTATLDPARTAEGPVPVAVANPFGAGRFVYVGFTLENIPTADRANAFSLLLTSATGRSLTHARSAQATPAAAPTVMRTPTAVASVSQQMNQTLLPAPIAVSPTPGIVITEPAVRFQWRGPGQPDSARYEICVSELGLPCSAPTSVVFKLTGKPITEITLENRSAPGAAQSDPGLGVPTGTATTPPYFYPATLPLSLRGKRLQWSVVACASDPARVSLAGKNPETCAASSPSTMSWSLPAPTLTSPADNAILGTFHVNTLITPPQFAWTHGEARVVEYFLLCIAKPGVACPSTPGIQRDALTVMASDSMSKTITQDLSPFIGQTLNWTVAACNSAVGCSYQLPARRLRVPVLDGTFESIYPITQNDKCLNCHQMHLGNAVYVRHVDLGRFTRAEIPPANVARREVVERCRTCHTAATGFTATWSAPGERGSLITREPMSFATCKAIARSGDGYELRTPHLRGSEDIRWAANQIAGLGAPRWLELVNNWSGACPCDQTQRTNCSLRGQFIP